MRDVQAAGEPPLTESDEPGDDGPAASPRRRRFLLLLGTAVVWYALDQISKALIVAHYGDGHVSTLVPNVLQVEESRNAGAAFGIGTGATVVFAVVALVVIVLIARTARRLRSRAWALSLGLLLGGAAGNLTDRIARSPGVFRGRVVDWVYLHHWPVFNLADAGIVVGGILAVLLAARGLSPDGSRSRD